jgi:hypothetical protein
MSDEPTTLQPSTTQPLQPLPPSGGSPWAQGLNRLGAYALIAPVAWKLPTLLEAGGLGAYLGSFLVLAVGAPTAAVHFLELVSRLRGK